MRLETRSGAIQRSRRRVLRQLLDQFVDNRQARSRHRRRGLSGRSTGSLADAIKPLADEQLCAHLELAEFHIFDVITNRGHLDEMAITLYLAEARSAHAQRSDDDLKRILLRTMQRRRTPGPVRESPHGLAESRTIVCGQRDRRSLASLSICIARVDADQA